MPLLVQLILSKNAISDIQFLDSLPLEILYLNHNAIISFDVQLPCLKTLNLSHNLINNTNNIDFLPQLTYLNLQSNKLSTVKDLDHFPLLQHIILSKNRIVAISSIHHDTLSTFDVSHNKLKNIPSYLSMVTIHFNNNHLNDLNSIVQAHYPYCTTFSLSNNAVYRFKHIQDYMKRVCPLLIHKSC